MQPLMTHLEAAGGDVKVDIRLYELARVNSVNLLDSQPGGAAVVGVAGFDLQVLHFVTDRHVTDPALNLNPHSEMVPLRRLSDLSARREWADSVYRPGRFAPSRTNRSRCPCPHCADSSCLGTRR